MKMDMYSPTRDVPVLVALWELNKDVSITDRMYLLIGSAGDYLYVTSAKTDGNGGTTGVSVPDVTDGAPHAVRLVWKINSLKLYLDGAVIGTEDTLVDPPTGITEITVGQAFNNNFQANCGIRNLKIYKKYGA
jgi:hypothetical protein